MRKICCGLILILLCMCASAQVFAQDGITILVNGAKIDFDVEPFIYQDRTMVPMRAIFEALNAEVSWNEATSTAIAEKDVRTLEFTIGSKDISVNENTALYPCDVAPMLVNERTFVPLRAIGEAFDCDVSWDGETRTVTVNDKKPAVDFTYEQEKIILETNDEFAKVTVNYTYPVVKDGKGFIAQEDVKKLNAIIAKQKSEIFDPYKFASTFADEWFVVIENGMYNYPDISFDIKTQIYTSEKYGTVSLVTGMRKIWTGADILAVTLNKDTLSEMSLAQCFANKAPEQLYKEVYAEMEANYENVRYGIELFTDSPEYCPFAISDNDLYVQIPSVLLTGVGRVSLYYTAIKEY